MATTAVPPIAWRFFAVFLKMPAVRYVPAPPVHAPRPTMPRKKSQNGAAPDVEEEMDGEQRYIRNARDLSRLVATDTIYT